MHVGSSEWARTHALPFSRAFAQGNPHAVVSSSCHFSFLTVIFKVFISILLADGCELRGAGVAFRKFTNHFLEVVPPKGRLPPFSSKLLVLCWL